MGCQTRAGLFSSVSRIISNQSIDLQKMEKARRQNEKRYEKVGSPLCV